MSEKSVRESGYYCVRRQNDSPWVIARWNSGCGRWSFTVGVLTPHEVHEVGRRIDPEPEIEHGGPPPVTLQDVVRVLEAAMNLTSPRGYITFSMSPHGNAAITRDDCLDEIVGFGSLGATEDGIRAAIDFLDNKPTRTITEGRREA